ncbi:hypothetical protein CFIMG_008404RA00001 [Ceratocystis fimbriata CBS 114723]|uniref:Uncharacterized protein n=1 Tax=Ceratocystis fimbriata CBS 114723 TaxID=1035309 RepID=A0A2C5WUW5_9PEZI|nr:hypothetical protein CFIMG_008404RA00001 [Ceratocystis fimbriata CBS 114723]
MPGHDFVPNKRYGNVLQNVEVMTTAIGPRSIHFRFRAPRLFEAQAISAILSGMATRSNYFHAPVVAWPIKATQADYGATVTVISGLEILVRQV